MNPADKRSKNDRKKAKKRCHVSWFEERVLTENVVFYTFKASPTSANQMRKYLLEEKKSSPYFLFKTGVQFDPEEIYADLLERCPFLSVTNIRRSEKKDRPINHIVNESYYYLQNRREMAVQHDVEASKVNIFH